MSSPDASAYDPALRSPDLRAGDVYAFILRVCLDRSPAGGSGRRRFELEDLGEGLRWTHTELDRALACLAERVEAIFRKTEPRNPGPH